MTTKGTATELGTLPIRKLLTQYSIPAIIAMTAASLYNMIDSIYIGHGVGAMAISGLALTFPLMNLAAAFGSLVGVGAATLISVRLGQKDYDTAKNVLATPREELIERADLEESTVDDVLAILAAEFEDDEPVEEGPEAEEEYEDNGEIPEDEAENSDGSDENNNEKEEH